MHCNPGETSHVTSALVSIQWIMWTRLHWSCQYTLKNKQTPYFVAQYFQKPRALLKTSHSYMWLVTHIVWRSALIVTQHWHRGLKMESILQWCITACSKQLSTHAILPFGKLVIKHALLCIYRLRMQSWPQSFQLLLWIVVAVNLLQWTVNRAQADRNRIIDAIARLAKAHRNTTTAGVTIPYCHMCPELWKCCPCTMTEMTARQVLLQVLKL